MGACRGKLAICLSTMPWRRVDERKFWAPHTHTHTHTHTHWKLYRTWMFFISLCRWHPRRFHIIMYEYQVRTRLMLSIKGLNRFVQWRVLEIIASLLLSFLDRKVPKLSLSVSGIWLRSFCLETKLSSTCAELSTMPWRFSVGMQLCISHTRNPCTKRRRVVRFMPRPLCPPEKRDRHHAIF